MEMTNEQRIHNIVALLFGVDVKEITNATNLTNDLNADSLDQVELVMDVEDEFNLTIPDEEADKIKTVGEIVAWVNAHVVKELVART